MELHLADRVAVVTGAGSGIGLATCRRLVEEGALVIGGDIEPYSGAFSGSGGFVGVEVDLASVDGPPKLIEHAKDEAARGEILEHLE